MMAAGHRAAASPFAVGYAWTLVATDVAPGAAAVAGGFLVVFSSTWPDLDHPRFKGRVSIPAFFAWLVRVSGFLGYAIRTKNDVERGDYHRGPSHCVEWALLLGALISLGLERAVPVLGTSAWVLGGAVTLGCVAHIAADAFTPSGVPVSAVWNFVVHREVWRRHSLRLIATDSALEHLAWTPLCYALTGAMALSMVGLLRPVLGFLVGV